MPAPRLSSPSVHPAVVRRFHSTKCAAKFSPRPWVRSVYWRSALYRVMRTSWSRVTASRAAAIAGPTRPHQVGLRRVLRLKNQVGTGMVRIKETFNIQHPFLGMSCKAFSFLQTKAPGATPSDELLADMALWHLVWLRDMHASTYFPPALI